MIDLPQGEKGGGPSIIVGPRPHTLTLECHPANTTEQCYDPYTQNQNAVHIHRKDISHNFCSRGQTRNNQEGTEMQMTRSTDSFRSFKGKLQGKHEKVLGLERRRV